jgi:TolB-like protein
MPLQPGARLGPYEILAPLGAGGMGEVYRARDPRLGRTVAIKVLPPDVASDSERRARFEREARAASGLNHPSIVTIHEFGSQEGTAYLVMECVEGRTLRAVLGEGVLAGRRVLDIAAGIADGLASAHSAGIAHRDLKPENIMLTKHGVPKILDFGLAKIMDAGNGLVMQDATEGDPSLETRSGVMLGTMSYMSPEQASGQRADFRSDQFALGVILYEMLTGRHPFRHATSVETLSAIVRGEREPLGAPAAGVPLALHRIVERCLAQQPDDRYGSTRDLARDLRDLRDDVTAGLGSGHAAATATRSRPGRRVALAGLALMVLAALVMLAAPDPWRAPRPSPSAAAAPGGEPRSIAVLPLQTQGGKAEDDYFTDGISESILTDLAKVRGLLVVGRNAAFQYKGRRVDVKTVGQELGVRYVLEGSAQRAGETLRVNVQLVDAGTGYQVWADRYDRATRDVFAVQDDISRQVVGALRLTLRPGGAGGSGPPTSNLEAYDAYLRGLFLARRFGAREESIPWFEKALALDPRFGLAHAALAHEYGFLSFVHDPGREWEAKAFVEAEKALAIDPELALPYVVRGGLLWTLPNRFQHERAAENYQRALSIDPNSEVAHSSLASVYEHVGLLDRALEHYNAALRRDAGQAGVLLRIARVHLYRREYDTALGVLRGHPQLARDWQVVLALDYLGRREEAHGLAEELIAAGRARPGPWLSDSASVRAILSARAGNAQAVQDDVDLATRHGGGKSHFHHAAHNIASAYALLGRKADALTWLRRTAQEGMPCYPLFRDDPNLDGLRSDRAFQSFLAEMKARFDHFSTVL